MLASVAFSNLVNFGGIQRFRFTNGKDEGGRMGIFIGENGSGKSAIFEIIRRTVSGSINVTMTNLCDANKDAFIACQFDYNTEAQQLLRETFTQEEIGFLRTVEVEKGYTLFDVIKRRGIECIYSMVFIPRNRSPRQANHKPTEVFKALVMKIEGLRYVIRAEHGVHDGHNFTFESIVPRKEADPIGTLSLLQTFISGNAEDMKNFFDMFEEESQSSNTFMVSIGNFFAKALAKLNMYLGKSQDTDCDQLSSIFLENLTVFTFGHIGISPIVWSKGSDLKNKDNYYEAVRRADILTRLLPRESREDAKTFETTFGYKFSFNKGHLDLQVTDLQVPDRPFPLLKCPEGILQAKTIELLVSEKQYFTICVEEPDRTMHPQLIGQIRHLLLEKAKSKTILLTSHSSEWITPRTVPAIVLCRRGPISKDTNATQIISAMNVRDYDLTNYVSRQNVRDMFLASRVLFVEGITDESVVNSMIFLSKTRSNSLPPFVVNVQGKDVFSRFCEACKLLKIEYKVLCDLDAVMKKTADSNVESILKHSTPGKKFSATVQEGIEYCRTLTTTLSKKQNDKYKFLKYVKNVQAMIHELCQIPATAETSALYDATALFLGVLKNSPHEYKNKIRFLVDNLEKYLDIFYKEDDGQLLSELISCNIEESPELQQTIKNIETHRSTLDRLRHNLNSLSTEESDERNFQLLEVIWKDMVTDVNIVYSMYIFCEPDPKSYPTKTFKNLEAAVPGVNSNAIFQTLESEGIFSWRSGDLEDMIAMSQKTFLPVTKVELTAAKQRDLDTLVNTLMKESSEFRDFMTFALE